MDAADVEAGEMFANHKVGVIRREVLESQGLVAGHPVTLDLDDDNIGFGGGVSFNVNWNVLTLATPPGRL